MAVLRLCMVFLLFFSAVSAQFNEFQFQQEEKDSVFTEEKELLLSEEPVVKRHENSYVSNIIFAGNGLKSAPIRSTIYKSLDIVCLVGAVSSFYLSSEAVNEAKSFAAIHAGVYPNSDTYSEIGKIKSLQDADGAYGYNTMWAKYDSLQLSIDEIDDNNWVWDSKSNMETYTKLVSNEKKYDNRFYMFVGGLILNRMVSSLDIAISSRTIKVRPEVNSKKVGVTLRSNL